nr:chorismate mutase [Brevibacillus laterosporus]
MKQLEQFRVEINQLDAKLVELLGQRFSVCLEVAQFKKEQQIPMMQPDRIEIVKQSCRELGQQHGVNGDFIDSLYTLIIGEACRLETEIIGVEDLV